MTACSYPPPSSVRHFLSQGFAAKSTKTRAFFGFLALAVISAKIFSKSQKSCVRASKVRAHFVLPARFQGKCERILFRRSVFEESADAFCFPEAISRKVRTHFACSVRFCGKCGRILFRRSVFGESADALRFPEAILWKVQTHFASSQRDALLTTFCLLAPLAFLPFHGKKHKNSRRVFGVISTRLLMQPAQ